MCSCSGLQAIASIFWFCTQRRSFHSEIKREVLQFIYFFWLFPHQRRFFSSSCSLDLALIGSHMEWIVSEFFFLPTAVKHQEQQSCKVKWPASSLFWCMNKKQSSRDQSEKCYMDGKLTEAHLEIKFWNLFSSRYYCLYH